MKICVYGAGAIGGYVATRLSISGFNVSLIARGQNLEKIKKNGLTVVYKDFRETASLKVSSELPTEKQDFVFIATKTTSLIDICPNIKKLSSKGSTIIPLMNGIPHWYFYGIDSKWKNTDIKCLDPTGEIKNSLPWENIIGSVVYPACELVEPGIIKHIYGNRFSIGEITGMKTNRVSEISELLIHSGLKAPIRTNIRAEIWVKLLGNLALNSISSLTSDTLSGILSSPTTEKIVRALMRETENVATALNIKMPISIDKRIEGAKQVGAHKTSMLQDLENGREMEIDSIISAVQELGVLTRTKTPTIDIILPLLKKRASLAGCYKGA